VTTDSHGHAADHDGGPAPDSGDASGHGPSEPERTLKVLVYSDDRAVRQQVVRAIGRRPAAGLPRVEYVECATEPVVIKTMDAGGVDLAILDGEAVPAGGMGICRQLKDEIYRCPPVLVLLGRPQDAWLATWSKADAVVAHPIDPIVLARTAAAILAPRVAPAPTRA
jgi:DNA-binding response OmpR family regulator